MALFHFSVTQVKRSAGQSVIAAAAYRAGERLYSEYYGDVSDYTKKGGVIHSDILLPPQAPEDYQDRQTLWNAVEKAERGKAAQLAYSFDIALQNEFSRDENMALIKQFLEEQLLSRGMVIDYAIHEPDTEDGGIPNPHFHVLCPIRPIDENRKWGFKQRREYVLDERGNRILDDAGKPVFNAVHTTDWGRPETLETWRQAWADLCNAKFAEKELSVRIDHRSYERQGLETIPTVHEGPTVRAMEAKGLPTNKGSLNRWIRETNRLINLAKQRIAGLISLFKQLRTELASPQVPLLSELLMDYLTERNVGAWSDKAKVSNLKEQTQIINYLEAKNLKTVDELMDYLSSVNNRIDGHKETIQTNTSRMKELNELLRMATYYTEGKPIADKLNSIHFKGRREAFKAEHDETLRKLYMAQRKLKPHFTQEGNLPITKWRKELVALKQKQQETENDMRPLYSEVKGIWKIRNMAQQTLDKHRKATQKSTKGHEIG
jgi:ATP-dependent exoDNAse (exonuclease V) alpha subunit